MAKVDSTNVVKTVTMAVLCLENNAYGERRDAFDLFYSKQF